MNSDEIWLLQLWSGAIGSFVAAVIGGLVALFVVRMTNKQQRSHVEEGRVIAAIADFVAETQALRSVYDAGDDWAVEERYLRMKAATVRLSMASKAVWTVSQLLAEWTYQLRRATILYDRADLCKSPSTDSVARMIEAVCADVSGTLPEWVFGIRIRREQQFPMMGKKLEALTLRVNELEDEVERELALRKQFILPDRQYPS